MFFLILIWNAMMLSAGTHWLLGANDGGELMLGVFTLMTMGFFDYHYFKILKREHDARHRHEVNTSSPRKRV